MAVHPWMEYGPVSVEMRVFQFARSVASPGGSAPDVNCGNARPDNRFDDPVVGDAARFVARLCSAVGTELISWESCVAMSELAALPACVTAADCAAAADGFVVCGGSVNVVNCDAAADEPA